MNPLQFLFFLGLFIDDYFFKDGKLTYLYLTIVIIYTIVYLFASKSAYHDSKRNLQMATYSHSWDSTIISTLKFRSEKSKKLIEALSKKYNKKITWNLFITKVVGNAIACFPEILQALKFSKVRILFILNTLYYNK